MQTHLPPCRATVDQDLGARVKYLTKFIEFGPEDHRALNTAADIVRPLFDSVLDAICEWTVATVALGFGIYTLSLTTDIKFFSFDITTRPFLPRSEGYDGPLDEKLSAISHESPQINSGTSLRLMKLFDLSETTSQAEFQ